MRKGHTLLELLLVMAICALVAAMFFANYTGAGRRRHFREQTDRFVTLLKALRSQAAIDARRLRIEFAEAEIVEGYRFFVSSEPDSLGTPGEFIALSEGAWMRYFDFDNMLIKSSELDPADAMVAAVGGADSEGLPLPITFYPDGSSDSAEIVLFSSDSKITTGVKVTLDGKLGAVRTAILSSDVLDQTSP